MTKFFAIKITHKHSGTILCDVVSENRNCPIALKGAVNFYTIEDYYSSVDAVDREDFDVQITEIEASYEELVNLQKKKVWIVYFLDYSNDEAETGIVGSFSTEKQATDYVAKWEKKYPETDFYIKETVLDNIDIDTNPYDAGNGLKTVSFTCRITVDYVDVLVEQASIGVAIDSTPEEICSVIAEYLRKWKNEKVKISYS